MLRFFAWLACLAGQFLFPVSVCLNASTIRSCLQRRRTNSLYTGRSDPFFRRTVQLLTGAYGLMRSKPVFFAFLWFPCAWLDSADTPSAVTGILFAYLRGNAKKRLNLQAETVANASEWDRCGPRGQVVDEHERAMAIG